MQTCFFTLNNTRFDKKSHSVELEQNIEKSFCYISSLVSSINNTFEKNISNKPIPK